MSYKIPFYVYILWNLNSLAINGTQLDIWHSRNSPYYCRIEALHNVKGFMYLWLLVLNNSCNPIWWCRYDACDFLIVKSYGCIHEGVCHHVVNLCMHTWIHDTHVHVCNKTHWHSFPNVAYVVIVLLSHLFLCYVIYAFGLCSIVLEYWVVGGGGGGWVFEMDKT